MASYMIMYMCVSVLVTGQVLVLPVQVLLSLPEMVYPGSQVQWVVPCTMVQRDGRTKAPVVAAGKIEAAAAVAAEVAAEVFVMVTKTEWGRQERGEVSRCRLCFHSLL